MRCETDAWGLDVVVSGSQKALMTPPGSRAVRRLGGRARRDRLGAALLLRLGADAQGAGEARRRVHAARLARRRASTSRSGCCSRRASRPRSTGTSRLGRACRAGAKAMGLELFSPDEDRSAVVTAVRIARRHQLRRRRQGPARPLRHDDRERSGRASKGRFSGSGTSAGSTSSTSRRSSRPSSSCSPTSVRRSSAASE